MLKNGFGFQVRLGWQQWQVVKRFVGLPNGHATFLFSGGRHGGTLCRCNRHVNRTCRKKRIISTRMQDLSNWATCRDEIDRNLLQDFQAAAAVLLILPRTAQALCRIAHQRVRDFMRDASGNLAPRTDSYEVVRKFMRLRGNIKSYCA